MAKKSVDIIVPAVGKSLNLLIPEEISCDTLLEMAISFAEEQFHLHSQGDLYLVKTGEKLAPSSTFSSIGENSGLTLLLM